MNEEIQISCQIKVTFFPKPTCEWVWGFHAFFVLFFIVVLMPTLEKSTEKNV
jgi:hypothetical protein